MWAGSRRGIKVHSLEVFGAVVFAAFVGLGVWVPPRHSSTGWSCGPGKSPTDCWPFTRWPLSRSAVRSPSPTPATPSTANIGGSPLFIRVNYILSAVWAGAFLINTAVGTFGDAVLHDGDNFWTGWIVQLAVTLIAVAITEFYPPDYARAKFLAATGESAEAPPPSFGKLLDWLPGFVIGIDIAGWVSDSFPAPVGIALIVVGVLAGAVMRKLFPREGLRSAELGFVALGDGHELLAHR